ncbi:hypothetical protein TREES_T100015613 [Tupaia chinensis]|uniref:Uncharacterized protein n=1 Tax=Tupaia chinensis TaxID=246437 RepID=L9L965_TUPCH|nr:hypothetical protein TREES_T100015613 [Tupaia chinensis]
MEETPPEQGPAWSTAEQLALQRALGQRLRPLSGSAELAFPAGHRGTRFIIRSRGILCQPRSWFTDGDAEAREVMGWRKVGMAEAKVLPERCEANDQKKKEAKENGQGSRDRQGLDRRSSLCENQWKEPERPEPGPWEFMAQQV